MQRVLSCSSRAVYRYPSQIKPTPLVSTFALSGAWRTYSTPVDTSKLPEETGTTTASKDVLSEIDSSPPSDQKGNSYKFITGHALFAKRPSRPFPPPFLSLPSSSFSDPLSTHNRSVDKRRVAKYQGQPIRGVTNGDDAVLAEPHIIAIGDGVGAWAQKERGHAALWSRLILHFWASEATRAIQSGGDTELGTFLQKSYEATKEATGPPNEWFGTTTASGATLAAGGAESGKASLQVTQLGDSAVLVLRPSRGDEEALLYKTEEQWHWFDCPRQLGTNSPDTPDANAVTDRLEIEDGDVVVAVSDGVSDNLWIHEVVANVCNSIREEQEALKSEDADQAMLRVARELMRAARVIAEDPFAESPFMERAVEEGLPTEGGKSAAQTPTYFRVSTSI